MIGDFGITSIIIVLVSLVIAITIHEAVHAYVGYFLGDDTAKEHGRISLNPFRHIDPFSTIVLPIITLIVFKIPLLAAKPVPFNPERVKYGEFGAAMIAVAGPLSNLVMAAVAAGIINIFQGGIGVDMLKVLYTFMGINIGLFIFNMIPIPPLDGSRLLFAFAPEPLQNFMAMLERFGVVLIFALIIMVPEAFNFINNIYNTIFNFLLV